MIMRRKITMASIVCCALGIVTLNVDGQSADRVRLDSVVAERVDADHFRAVIKLVNGTKSDIYIQSGLEGSRIPYPVYLERRVEKDEWQTVAPCVDSPPTGAIRVRRAESLTIDRVYSLELSAVCRTRRIDPLGQYRWRIEYFTSKADLMEYQKTEGHSGRAFSVASTPFSIEPGDRKTD